MFSVLSMLFCFTSFYFQFISYCVLRVTCMGPVVFFFLFLLMIYVLYSHCLYMSGIIFLLPLSFISSLSSSQSFYFFNTTSHWGRIHQMNSNSMVYPPPLITLGKPWVSIIIIIIITIIIIIIIL